MTKNYQHLIYASMIDLIKRVLLNVEKNGLHNDHSLYISFYTNKPNVVLSQRRRQENPKEITIVLQHQFSNLNIKEDSFSVDLVFQGVKENIQVPFMAIISFVDPASHFHIKLQGDKHASINIMEQNKNVLRKPHIVDFNIDLTNNPINHDKHNVDVIESQLPADIVSIDNFRKKDK